MKAKSFSALAVIGALAVVVFIWWVIRSAVPLATKTTTTTPIAQAPMPMPADALHVAPTPIAASAVQFGAEQLDGILARLSTTDSPEMSRKILAELRSLLDSLPRDVASREVLSFLGLQKDAATKLEVTVQAGGALGDASSLRVFLLGYLGEIDRTAAAAIGKQILSAPTAADEWAVSLRNVAWADDTPGNRAYLRAKAGEMIANPAWRQNPSSGFLEAFDVVVHARGFDLAPQLTELVRDKENRAVAHAAYLTLDRLTIADPATALAALAAQPELMEGREQTRANFFARADVGNPQQKALLEGYLLDPRRSAQELQTFAGLFPNANYMVSNNLLTATATPAHADLAVRDRDALAVVESWSQDSRFAALKPQIEAIRARLSTFVQQAAANP